MESGKWGRPPGVGLPKRIHRVDISLCHKRKLRYTPEAPDRASKYNVNFLFTKHLNDPSVIECFVGECVS